MSTRQATIRAKRNGFSLSIVAMAGSKYVAFLRKHLLDAWPLIENAPRELSLALVNDERMAQLHKQFLNIAAPTDVLTFELDHDSTGRCTGGEVIICVPEAQRRAADLRIEIENELLLYALHGLLHLSGFDDRTDSSYRKMHQREDQILEELGIGKLFHRVSDSKRPSARNNRPAGLSRRKRS